MTTVVKIDGNAIELAELVRTLKLTGQFTSLLEQFTRDRLTILGAKKAGIQVSDTEIRERADQFRRMRGLHRASDTNKYLDAMRITLEEFEAFITDSLYQEKMMSQVCDEQAVQAYFKLHSPKFDSIEIGHIVVDSEGKAKELLALLGDDPDSFDGLAREHSIASTRASGNLMGKVTRGSLRPDIEAKLFSAAVGDLLGPFASADRQTFELLRVNAKHCARLDEGTATEVQRLLCEEWLQARAEEHLVEVS